MKEYAFTIKDIDWIIKLQDDKTYELQHGNDSDGLTRGGSQKIYIKKSKLTKRLITHELLHAYVASCCVHSIEDLSVSGMEELCAEILEFHLEQIAELSDLLYNKLKAKKKAK